MESDFFLVLLLVTLVCLACSAQKTVHSLCFSVKHANCNNLNSIFRLQPSIIRISQQLPYNYSYLIENFSPISFIFSRHLFSGIILSDSHLDTLVYPRPSTRRSIFRSDGNNVGSRVKFSGSQLTKNLFLNFLSLDFMKQTLTPSVLLKSPLPNTMSETFNKNVKWDDDVIAVNDETVTSKAKGRSNSFQQKRTINRAKKPKIAAEPLLQIPVENDNEVQMTENNTAPTSVDFVHQYFFTWINRLHDYPLLPANNVALTKCLAPFLFTNAQFLLLEENRVTVSYSWARDAYDNWSSQFTETDALTAEEVDRYSVYASVLRIEKLHDIKRILNIDFSDLVRILETEDKFNSEVKQQLESWYKELADSSMQAFTKFYDESIPELPEVYHERATFVWQDLASAHCCLGDKLFEDPQDDEAPSSIKPLAQSDPEIVQSNQAQIPLPAYSVGAGNDEAFVITDTATRQSGLVAKQWTY